MPGPQCSFRWLLTAVTVVAGGALRAQPAAGLPDDSAAAGAATVYGYVGAYYGYDLGQPRTRTRPAFIYSHHRHNEFALNLALVGVRVAGARVRGAVAVQAGTYPETNYAAEPLLFRVLHEAWAGVRLRSRLWLEAGVFGSHLGAESARSAENLTLTRSLVAELSPYYEAGARLAYATASDRWLLTALVLNGWQVVRDRNENKAVGWQVQWRPAAAWVVNSSSYAGEGLNQPDSLGRRLRYFHNFYVAWQPTERLRLLATVDGGAQRRAAGGYEYWQGAALIARRYLSRQVALAGRVEAFRDPAAVVLPRAMGRAAAGTTVAGASVGVDFFPVPRAVVRLEGKAFYARQAVFGSATTPIRRNAACTALLGLTL